MKRPELIHRLTAIALPFGFILLVIVNECQMMGASQPTRHNSPNVSSTTGHISAGPYFVEYPKDYRFILDEPAECQQQKPFVVLIVPVNPHDRARRDTIRRTWGHESRRSSVLGKRASLFFLLGMPTGERAEQAQHEVLEESSEHRDLIQSDFLDSYNNLTVKTMVMMEWLQTRCPMASYAMKIDSDMFLNTHSLIDLLLKAPKDNYMTGHVARWAPVIRDTNSKWFLPRDAFAASHYPPYALGGGYIFSLDLPRKLLEASRHVPAIYIEDVYLGLCMEYLDIPLTDLPSGNLFYNWPIDDIRHFVQNGPILQTLKANLSQSG